MFYGTIFAQISCAKISYEATLFQFQICRTLTQHFFLLLLLVTTALFLSLIKSSRKIVKKLWEMPQIMTFWLVDVSWQEFFAFFPYLRRESLLQQFFGPTCLKATLLWALTNYFHSLIVHCHFLILWFLVPGVLNLQKLFFL